MIRIYVIIGLIVSVIVSFYIAFNFGKTEERKEWELKQEQAIAQIKNLEAQAAVINEVVVTKYVDKIKYIDRVKIQTVKEFVTVENDKHCIVNNGFVRVHDASATSQSITPQPSDSLPSTVALSTVADTVKDNYTEYNKVKTQLEELQAWIRSQEKLWNEKK